MSNTYFSSIWLNFHFTVKTFAKLLDYAANRRASIKGIKISYKDAYGEQREVYFSIDAKQMDGETGIFYIIPSWTDSETGKDLTQRIEVEQQESHLIAGAHVYYFLCPVLHRRCKKLYLIGDGFRCSRAFKHHYPQQNKSHVDRLYYEYHSPEPYRDHGKTHYRGKLTPYGKRVQKYEEKIRETEQEIFLRIRKKFHF